MTSQDPPIPAALLRKPPAEWRECPNAGEGHRATVPFIYRPHLPFADDDGMVELPCIVCEAESYRACEAILGAANTAFGGV